MFVTSRVCGTFAVNNFSVKKWFMWWKTQNEIIFKISAEFLFYFQMILKLKFFSMFSDYCVTYCVWRWCDNVQKLCLLVLLSIFFLIDFLIKIVEEVDGDEYIDNGIMIVKIISHFFLFKVFCSSLSIEYFIFIICNMMWLIEI